MSDKQLGAQDDLQPARAKAAFHCPSCGVYADQLWGELRHVTGRGNLLTEFFGSRCNRCEATAIWLEHAMVYPPASHGPEPAPNMPTDVLEVYEEARAVAQLSRRSAAGLLRLALQMLVDDLEPGSGTIDTKIGALVSKGLSPQVQQAMDVLRVVGNESVHPGTIDVNGDESMLVGLFKLLNLIVDQMITRPNEVAALFSSLPPSKREAIARRDGDSSTA